MHPAAGLCTAPSEELDWDWKRVRVMRGVLDEPGILPEAAAEGERRARRSGRGGKSERERNREGHRAS